MTPTTGDDVCETVSQEFRFHRYHTERLRRKNQEASNEQGGFGFNNSCLVDGNFLGVNPQITTGTFANSEALNETNKDISEHRIRNCFASLPLSPHRPTNVLENLINCTVVVDENGNIKSAEGSPETKYQSRVQVDLGTTLLLRNIQNSCIVIQNSLPALHIDNVHYTQIYVQRAVESTIHVTKAIDSDLVVLCPARQLRIHRAIRLQVTIGDHVGGEDQPKDNAQSPAGATTVRSSTHGWNSGSIILEHSKHVTFIVPTEAVQEGSSFPLFVNSLWMSVIKDFGWLRTSAPSPNFSIQGIAAAVSHQVSYQETDSSATASNLKALPTTSRYSDEDDDDDDDEL
jgi:hypothetical protein